MTTVSPHAACCCGHADLSTEAAAILLTLAMRETESPVADLGAALERMCRALSGAHRGNPATETSGNGATAPTDPVNTALHADLTVCVRSLQFHDRLIQQLAVIRKLLATLTHRPMSDLSGFGAQRWEELLGALRARLNSDSHQQIFDLLIRTGGLGSEGSEAKPEGSVELF